MAGNLHQRSREMITAQQVSDIHLIIERHSTDVIDYEMAADDINAYLFSGDTREKLINKGFTDSDVDEFFTALGQAISTKGAKWL